DESLQTDMIVVGDIILTEVLQGFHLDREFRKARDLLLNLPFLPMLGRDMAVKSAVHYRKLRKIGITPRKTIDVCIATFCLHYNLPLLHNDHDFDIMAEHLGLQVV
ncbi:MAG: PIN domain-containing protein, partial [Candidatus Aminicenantes bacterium]|nr:PIN domain-containing protein [Candidatus Aminicenantes bacterium]